MQPETFLSVPLRGHAAISGQVKAHDSADHIDFGRVFASLRGDETKREAPKIEAVPQGRPVKASDGDSEDTAILDDEAEGVEEALSLEMGESDPVQTATPADDGVLPGEVRQQSHDVTRPFASSTDHPGNSGSNWRLSADQLAADPSKPDSVRDFKRIEDGLRVQGQETRLVPGSSVLNRSAGITREGGALHGPQLNANDPVFRSDPVPGRVLDEALLKKVSTGLKEPQSEAVPEVRGETPTFGSRTGQFSSPFGESIALRQEEAHASQTSPLAGHAETRTSSVDGAVAHEKAGPRIQDMYSARDGLLTGSLEGMSPVPTGLEADLSDLPRPHQIADASPAQSENQAAAVLAATPSTSSSVQSERLTPTELPMAPDPTPRGSVHSEIGLSSPYSETRHVAVSPRNAAMGAGSARVVPNGGPWIDPVAGAFGPEARTVQGVPTPTGFADMPVDPVAMPRGQGLLAVSDVPASPVLEPPREASTPSQNRPGASVAIQGTESQPLSPGLIPQEHKQRGGLQDPLAQGKPALPVNVPHRPDLQNLGANGPVELQSERPYRNSPTGAFASTEDGSPSQPLNPGRPRQHTTQTGHVAPVPFSATPPEETRHVDHETPQVERADPQRQRFAGTSPRAEIANLRPANLAATGVPREQTGKPGLALDGRRVVPTSARISGVEMAPDPSSRVESPTVKTALPPTSGQPWPLVQRSGEIAGETDQIGTRLEGATEEPQALSKVNTKEQAVEIRAIRGKFQDPLAHGPRQAESGSRTGLGSGFSRQEPRSAMHPEPKIPVRHPSGIDRAQGSFQGETGLPSGTLPELREAVPDSRGRPYATEPAVTGTNRLYRLSEAVMHDSPERRRAPSVPSAGGGSDAMRDDFTESGQGRVEKSRSDFVQPPVSTDVSQRLSRPPEDAVESRHADRVDTVRSTAFETTPAQSARGEETAKPPTAPGEMPQPQESLAKRMAGAPSEVAMPRSLNEPAGLAPRDIPTGEAPAPPSPAQHAALARDVAQQLSQVTRSVPGEVTELTLRPEELGHVRMRLSGSDGQIVLQILSERPETHDLMRRHIDIVERAFRDLGYHDIAFDFSFSGQRKGASQPQGDATPADDTTQIAELPPAPRTVPRQLLVPGRLDIRL